MSRSARELVDILPRLAQQIPTMDVDLILYNRLIRQLAIRTTACFNECLRQHGLTESLWHALLAVYACPQHEILPSELSALLDLTRTSATRLSDDLVQRGWVVRQTHGGDRRKIMLCLTDAGIAKIHSVGPHTQTLRHRLWSALAKPEQQQLQSLLQRLLEQLDKVADGATDTSQHKGRP